MVKRKEVGESDLKLPANAAENGWLEDDSFPFGGKPTYFQWRFAVRFREV